MSDEIVCLGCGLPYLGGRVGPSHCSCVASEEAHEVACPGCGGSLRVGARACPYCRCTIATTRCGGCSAWNLAEAHFCQGCGEAIVEEAPASRTAEGPCPRC